MVIGPYKGEEAGVRIAGNVACGGSLTGDYLQLWDGYEMC